jgi:hypothetical protein
MVSMAGNDDAWIADVASFVRNSFGNSAGFVTPADVAAVRKAMGARRTPWTLTDLLPTVPTALENAQEWTLTASHNAEAAQNATGGTPGARWDSGGPQQPGMWLQIELPQATRISEVQIDSTAPQPQFGRGRGGAGGPGAGRGAAAARGGGPAGARGAAPQAGAPGAAGRGRGRGFAPPPPASGPVGFSVQVSNDGTTWSAPLAQGKGASTTTIAFKPTEARFVRITQTGTGTDRWGVARMRIYQAGK